ncbi:TetR/AcrR family transcriptional regulator C-terminal domain-containing protein [Nocardioides sp. 1609]|uniref:TetR/AcrR family transcriptional regulator C-terminal domain-containing protein n=1 Tax=Nocardioides sp. 1609 TaxID=2508327 RepID=UPI0010705FD0|nr:TetR/AcrR family transcriptional regulator C-terminal domain-containing protein [Nocardioides sp. 1609]
MSARDEQGTDADKAVVAGDEPPSERVPLSRDRIVVAAVEFIDERGLPGLTMRRLGERLGVEAMALYRYVPGRENLLDAIVEHVVGELREDDDVASSPTHGWQDFTQRLAHGIRRVALRHPRVFPLVASRPPEAPWLRPPLRSLEWVEVFLEALIEDGFSEDDAVSAYRSFTSFLLGHLLLEVAAHDADVGPLDVLTPDEPPGPGALDDYPLVARLRDELSADHADVEFEDALESLLARIALVQANPAS